MDAGRTARLLALATPVALLGGAYVAQYGFGLAPCEMCWWQRYAHFAALALAALGLLLRTNALTALAAVALAVAALIGGFHAGVEYHWWEGLTTCTASAAAGGDPLQAILDAPIVRCDAAAWSLFGISLAGWNFLISGAAATAIAILLAKGRTHE